MAITKQDIYDAYRKFKTFVYYNGQPLTLRHKLAEFEIEMLQPMEQSVNDVKKSFINKFETKTASLRGLLGNKSNIHTETFERWLNEIKYSIVPKQLKESPNINEHFISNEVPIEDYIVQRCNFIIDAPIELYLISTLWTMKLGKRLHRHISEDNYAYRLPRLHDMKQRGVEAHKPLSSGLMLYDPYFIGYQQWRDNGLNKVSQALNNKENAVILSLDVKRYFYNVRINVNDIVNTYIGSEKLDKDEERLCELLQRIHEQYARVVLKSDLDTDTKVMLPIGLPSSGLLGNLTLIPFDNYVRNHVSPTYYGRYVDDILLVFSGKGMKISKHTESGSFIDGFISDHLVYDYKTANASTDTNVRFLRTVADKNIRSHKNVASINSIDARSDLNPNNGICYCIETGDSKLYIQLGKVIMEYFNCNESKAAINKFKKQLEKNRSEFRYLPWEEEINLEFDDEAFRLEISESINKIRNIEGISEDKYGASKYLAKKIFLSTLPFESASEEDAEASAKQILTYFKGRTTILMNSLWEKVATYFVINNQPKHLEHFWKQAISAIDKVTTERAVDEDPNIPACTDREVKAALKEHLKISIAMAVSIIPSILSKCFLNKTENKQFRTMSENFRQTYLFRHQYQYLKGYCYTFASDEGQSLVGKNLISERVAEIRQDSYARFVSPVFLKPHEIALLHIYHELSHTQSPNFLATKELDHIFQQFNYEWRYLYSPKSISSDARSSRYFKDCLNVIDIKNSNPAIHIVEINDSLKDNNINPDKRIGIVNWKIEQNDLRQSILGQPNKSNVRREKLFEVLNYSAKKHVEMLVFPETSIPVEWLPLLADHAVRNNCAIIGGLEFYVTPSKGKTDSEDYLEGMEVYNLSFNIFPVRMPYYDTAAYVIRKKNYYAPSERQLIASYHKKEPAATPMYHLIHWRKAYFSTYNCFELSNISDRALFKSKVDFIVAIEYNRDIHYFANITESWTRDLHCFIVQTNSSDYGDTKVVQPTKNIHMDVMKIKGGDFPIVMITTLHIKELREYHRQDVSGQLDEKEARMFKPTPACYEWKWAERRIADESPSEYWFK